MGCGFRCWMTDSRSALMAHFIINMGLLVAVVSSGLVMLLLVFRKIRHRDEWKRNRVAFLSIWGLSCLFGSTWALAFFTSEASETVLFLFCIINSLQGEFPVSRSPYRAVLRAAPVFMWQRFPVEMISGPKVPAVCLLYKLLNPWSLVQV